MGVQILYITCGNREEARRIGKAAVESRLGACANIIGQMNSIYFWEDKLQDDSEAVLIIKTTEEKTEALMEMVKSLHSYDLPCMVCLPITGGYAPFLKWVADQTRQSGSSKTG
jgi:periplasmic divalent cation tolerance protein